MDFKLIVAGGRNFCTPDHRALLEKVMWEVEQELSQFEVSLVSGMARGADRLAWEFAKAHGITCHEFPADWEKYGKAAGFRRNQEMADFSDGLVAFWDGQSRGTKHMIETMKAQGKFVYIVGY